MVLSVNIEDTKTTEESTAPSGGASMDDQKQTNNIDLFSQDNQDYDNHHGQQLMTHKHDGGQGYCNQNNPQFIGHKHNGGIELGLLENVTQQAKSTMCFTF